MAKRIGYFDIARAVALTCVIIGHMTIAGVPWSIAGLCYTFDMPLFFIVSGYFVRDDARLDKAFVIKNAKALLLPYLVSSVILVALFGVRGALLEGDTVLGNITTWGLACLYGSGGTYDGMPEGIIGVGAIWYLLALFLAKIMLVAARRCGTLTPVVVAALFAAGYLSTPYIWLPWSIQAAMCAVAYMYFGQLVRRKGWLEHGSLHPAVWVVLAIAWGIAIAVGGEFYMVHNVYTDGVVDAAGGIAGTMIVIKGCQLLEEHAPKIAKPLQVYGSNTLPLFCCHLITLDVVPWWLLFPYFSVFSPIPQSLPITLFYALLMLALAGLLWLAPPAISGIFYPSRRKAHAS